MTFRFFLLGYSCVMVPRPLRKLFARSDYHRHWLAGNMGRFGDLNGKVLGVCERDWRYWRKGENSPEVSVLKMVKGLLFPFGLYFQPDRHQKP
jgi:hypothetical protein